MLEILSCIQDQHAWRYVVAAGLICILSSAMTVVLLRLALGSREGSRLNWLAFTGATAGLGIWATHFIAMLGYAPGVILGYDPALTVASLLIAIIMAAIGLAVAAQRQTALHVITGAIITALGVCAMHYCGMLALRLPAQMHWQPGYVIASILGAVLPMLCAFGLAFTRQDRIGFVGAASGMTLAVLTLHFTGMTGLEITPSHISANAMLIAPRAMVFLVSSIAIALIALAITLGVIVSKTAAAVRTSERQFALLVRGISDHALYMLNLDGTVASWNAGAQRLKGYRIEDVLGLPLATFYTPEDRTAGLPGIALNTARTNGKFTGEGWRVRRDGTRFWAQVTIEVVKDERGRAIGFAKITRDVTERKETLDSLATLGEQRDAALSHMHQGLCMFDAKGNLVLRNARFLEMYGLTAEQVPEGMPVRDVVRIVMTKAYAQPICEERIEEVAQRLCDSQQGAASSPIFAEYSDSFIVSVASRKLPGGGWVTTMDDITNQRQSEARIEHMALHDGLTGLPNRTRLNLWLEETIALAGAQERKVAVAVLDLNRFKDINDTFGHAWGDVVLAEIARRLSATLQEDEFAARLGGDEFALTKVYTSAKELDDFLRRVERCFEHPVTHEGQDLHFGASIGVSAFPEDGDDRETLLNNADLAMYRAKGQLGESLCFYESSMDESARARRKLANDLRQAIDRHELSLLYQPQCYLESGALSGYEALLRWHHPLRGSVPPDEFIPIAEEAGLIIPIGEWVLREACREAMHWQDDYRIAVNLSAIQLVQPDIASTVTRVLLETGLPARRLELEITETAIIADKARALRNLRQIKALGVGIAMDDFGTGYSSLDTLHSFPFDKIKIDKSFLLQSDKSEQAQAIIRAVLGLGQSLKIPVLAEGVETEEHLAMLLSEGCQEAQGYYLGRPGHAPSLLAQTLQLGAAESAVFDSARSA
ncbi:EAL domain-containing protein [Novosphingobium sp. 1949]|uniref:EAL domain-containing protein n=1 Tax=Novosphingobium organovorum TaxID=2930092 RepID=A0ABT0BEC0_9SPHN|nr:EAL domain-containing protein [Novosphingobium organovorum]MCJ2183394.1 EAL domain-containing protein [Novosphingobium organovorum]